LSPGHDHQKHILSVARVVGSALSFVACAACLSTPKRPVPTDSQPNSECGGTVEGKLSDGGAFGSGTLDGQPIVADLNNDLRDDLILWGREPVGDAMCPRVWVFYGHGNFTSLAHYDRRIDFATAIHAVSVGNVSSDNSNLNLMVLAESDGGDSLARFDFFQSATDPVIAPVVTVKNIGTGPYVLFEMFNKIIYVGGTIRYQVDLSQSPPGVGTIDSVAHDWANLLAADHDDDTAKMVAVFKDHAVLAAPGTLDLATHANFSAGPIEQFVFARRADLGLGPGQLYGVGVSATSEFAEFLSGGTTFVWANSLGAYGIAAAAAKIQRGPVAMTNTDAAVLTKNVVTGQLEVKLYEFAKSAPLAQVAVPAPANYIAAGKFRNNDPTEIGQLFVFATNPLSETCLEYGTNGLNVCN